MLDWIRKRKDSVISSFLIILVAIVMAFFGVNQFQNDERGGGVAAFVNGEPISRRDFQQELEMKLMQYQAMLGGQYDEKFLMALQVPQRTLEEMIQMKLLAQQAKKLGISVPDSELAEYIRSLPYYQKNGQFDAETYRKLPNPGLTERRQRERLELMRFQQYLSDRVRLTPAAVFRAYELRETKIDLEYAKIDFEALASNQKPAAGAVEAFLKSATEKELADYYESHKKDFTAPAQVKLRQIRAGVPFQAKEEQKAEAKKKIEAIHKDLTPQNFAELAKSRSDDEYAKRGGEVGWVSRGTLEPNLEAAIDLLEAGRVSQPIETPFGYFVLMVEEKRPEVVQPLSGVKRQIAEKLVEENTKKAFKEAKLKEWDALLASGKPLDAELKRYKIESKKTGPFSIGQGSIPGVGSSDTLMDAVFELTPKSPIAKRLIPAQDLYYYLKLKSLEAAKPNDLAKNRESVERAAQTSLQAELLTKWVAELEKKASVKKEIRF